MSSLLPWTELSRRVLSFLDGKSLARCEVVCQDLRTAAGSNDVWSTALQHHLAPAGTTR